jgi:hypothetical protein
MHNVIAPPDISLDAIAGTPDVRLQPKHQAGIAGGHATARSHTIRLERHITARDLHPGDVIQQYDWSLHVREVDVGHVTVAIAVTEFGFPLHYAAHEQIKLTA